MFEAKEYISWRWRAHGRAGVQAPFLFRLASDVLSPKHSEGSNAVIEAVRHKLLADKRQIRVTDLGAGAKTESSDLRAISYIARTSAKSPKWAGVLYRLVREFNPHTVIELGTSLGISGMYMASAIPQGKLLSLEGCPEIATLARENFAEAGFTNAEIITGPFDDTLPRVLETLSDVPFAYIDGNHTEAATLRYFSWLKHKATEKTVLVFDDIHWSEGMKRAWETICNDPAVTLTVDLFHLGLVFFNPGLSKQHVNLTV